MVTDQDKAHKFYTETLGFVTKHDIPMGEYKWLTVVSPEAPDGTELLLEPMGFEPARIFQQELYKAGIPATAFSVADIRAEYERLSALGVVFQSEPAEMGGTAVAAFDDTCGNFIQLYQPPAL